MELSVSWRVVAGYRQLFKNIFVTLKARRALRYSLGIIGYGLQRDDNELTSCSVRVAYALSVFPVRKLPSRELFTQWITYVPQSAKSAKDPSINQKLGRVPLVIFSRRREETRARIIDRINSPILAMLANTVLQTNTGRSVRACINLWGWRYAGV